MQKKLYFSMFLSLICILLSGCQSLKYKKVEAKDFPPDPNERIVKNIEEGKGFRIMGNISNNNGNFEFASSNPLWKAALDTIDFMPLVSANYSGGIIITDWYTDSSTPDESIKLTIRFLTNEIRADALDIKVFVKKCQPNLIDCSIIEKEGQLKSDLSLNILKKATLYNKNLVEDNKKKNPYVLSEPSHNKKK